MIPGSALRRDIYRKGLATGRRVKNYTDDARQVSLNRFLRRSVHRNDKTGAREVSKLWLDGWDDAEVYREKAAE